MPAGKYDFTDDQAILKGATFTKTFLWRDGLGALISLVGRTARMHIRASVNAPTIIIELTTENQRITLGGAAATVRLDLTAEQTAAITAKRGVYDLEIAAPDGSVVRFIEGVVEFSPEVTK